MAARYTVRTNKIPYELRRMGFVAWIADASHPDGSEAGASCAWHQDVRDAERIASALNRYAETREALRAERATTAPHADMKRPTEAEFKAARDLAERPDDDPIAAGAYQICRWYRGQMFIREDAEAALTAIRNDTIPHQYTPARTA